MGDFMDKDDINNVVLDILEKIHEKTEKNNNDLNEIKVELVRQNGVVTEHERRSTASEGRLELLEKDVQSFRSVIKAVVIIAGTVTFLAEGLPLVRLLASLLGYPHP